MGGRGRCGERRCVLTIPDEEDVRRIDNIYALLQQGNASEYEALAREALSCQTAVFLNEVRMLKTEGAVITEYATDADGEPRIDDDGNPVVVNVRPNPRAGDPVPEGVKHNVYQWDRVFTNNDVYKGGWAGQGLLVNPDRDLVAAYVGYSKDDEGSEMSPLAPLRRVLEGVFGQPRADGGERSAAD